MNQDIPPSGLPISDDDDAIKAAIEEASIPALMMSMVHMSGDASILDGPIKPQGLYINEVQGYMPEEDQAEMRRQAFEVIRAFRDGGCVLPEPPSDEIIHRMMNFMVAEDVPAEYVPMLLEEMELDGVDARDADWSDVDDAAKQGLHVAVIGGGMSGLLAAIRLKHAGVPFTVFEKNPAVGGTWYENRYPGCRVDVGNHFYCYSFEPNHDWTQFFATQPELQRYFENCLDKYGVRENFRFETEVAAARYDEQTHTWSVTVRSADGSEDTLEANAVISAVGQLNRPKLPEIDGIETFRGPSMHSAAWNDTVDLRGKRVAVVGTGASAFQIVPTIADDVASLTVFQRSAPWMFENTSYHREVGEGKKWVLKHLPYYARWYRFLLFWPACDGILPALESDPNWPHQERSVSEMHETIRLVFEDYLRQQCDGDEELIAKIIPDYVVLGKRTLQDNGSWLNALKRDDVELVTDAITEITEDAVVCANGKRYEVDVIIYATGFKADKFLWPIEISGRGGTTLTEFWGDDPVAYLGITVPGFPNLFCMYGPGTNLAFGGSLIFNSECQIRYTMGCLKEMVRRGASSVEVKGDVAQAYDERLQAKLEKMVWSHPSIKESWYYNKSGRVTVLSPWRLLDYWNWTKTPAPDDYTFEG